MRMPAEQPCAQLECREAELKFEFGITKRMRGTIRVEFESNFEQEPDPDIARLLIVRAFAGHS